MTAGELYDAIGPSVGNVVIRQGGQRVSSGTGFVASGKLVTAGHVLDLPPGLQVDVFFERGNENQTAGWSGGTTPLSLGGYSSEHSYDYAIVTPPSGTTLPPNLQWADEMPRPGEAVCALGYPFEDPHLTIHQGYISAVYTSGVATMLKLDMSVNPSNSGGPLVRMSDGKVLGVVTRKATGLTRAFDQLVQVMDANILALSQPRGGSISIGGLDPVQVALVTQQQLRQVASEIYRSANVGIGFAVWNEPLRTEAALSG